MQYLLAVILQNVQVWSSGREMIGLAAAVFAAVLAANAGWTLTDRLVARRSR
ncbi:hypothetical protein GCM10027589_20660 [Actinocorallia lasiicapitis]